MADRNLLDTGQHSPDGVQKFNYVVIGGGIAGVTCAETLSSLSKDQSILLVSASPIIKAITNFEQLSRSLQRFSVEEQPSSELSSRCPNVVVVHDVVAKFDRNLKEVSTQSGYRYHYNKLCLCTGGQPKVISEINPYVLGIRDTETILEFEKKLSSARRVVIVGNGGIATELVHRISSCDVVWAIKDKSIVGTFVDAGAAKFFMPQLGVEAEPNAGPSKRTKYALDVTGSQPTSKTTCGKSLSHGAALGPDWTNILPLRGQRKDGHRVCVEYECEVAELLTADEVKKLSTNSSSFDDSVDVGSDGHEWPVYVRLTTGRIIGCDFVVSATGVIPNTRPFTDDCSLFEIADDGGIKVNGSMKTAVQDVFAAGDVCHAAWKHSPFWLQMRLWSQARLMGYYAAQCMVNEMNALDSASSDNVMSEPPTEFGFELFAHITNFFGYKVVLLGRFNGQGLGNDHKLLIRVIDGEQYVKAVMQNGRMVGAVLVGETDLEETFENLILNQLDLSVYGDDLLDQDIEDFFD